MKIYKITKQSAIYLIIGFFILIFTETNARTSNEISHYKEKIFEMSLEEILDIPITIAAKKNESILNASGTVYIVTEDDIKKYGWRDLKEILNSIPNIDLMWQWHWLNGGQRGFTGNFSGTLLLIDGREVQNLLANESFIQNNYPSHRIKRVEVLQGPNSTLYGGNATQGVINIVTKFGANESRDISNVEVIFGEVGTEQFSGVFKKNYKDVEIGFSASHFTSLQNFNELAEFVVNDDLYSRSTKDKVRSHDSSLFKNKEENWTLNSYAKYKYFYGGFNYTQVNNMKGIEGVKYDFTEPLDWRSYRQTYLGLKHEFTNSIKAFIEYQNFTEKYEKIYKVAENANEATSYNELEFYISNRTMKPPIKDRIITQVDYKLWKNNHLILGYDWWKLNITDRWVQSNALVVDETEYFKEIIWPKNKSVAQKHSIFIQDSIIFIEKVPYIYMIKATAGIRYNKQDFTNDTWLPRGTLIYQPTYHSAIKLTYGQAFRPPTIFDFQGSIDESILSQKMEMYEFNYTQFIPIENFKLSNIFAAYSMKHSNFYTKKQVEGAANVWTTKVYGDYNISGLEDEIRLEYKMLTAFSNIRLAFADKTKINDKKIVKDIPFIKFKIGTSFNFLKYATVSLFLDYWSNVQIETNKSDLSGTEIYTVPSFNIVNLNFNYNLPELYNGMHGIISFYTENLFNKKYYHGNVRGNSPLQYLQAPRNFRIKISLNF